MLSLALSVFLVSCASAPLVNDKMEHEDGKAFLYLNLSMNEKSRGNEGEVWLLIVNQETKKETWLNCSQRKPYVLIVVQPGTYRIETTGISFSGSRELYHRDFKPSQSYSFLAEPFKVFANKVAYVSHYQGFMESSSLSYSTSIRGGVSAAAYFYDAAKTAFAAEYPKFATLEVENPFLFN